LVIHLHPPWVNFPTPNDEKKSDKIVTVLKNHNVKRIVTKAMGRYEHAFVFACDQASLPVAVINPIRVRRYAQAIGVLAKTDKLAIVNFALDQRAKQVCHPAGVVVGCREQQRIQVTTDPIKRPRLDQFRRYVVPPWSCRCE
jgi:transposase